MKLDPYLVPYIDRKTNSKWIKHLTVRPKTAKLLKEKHRKKFQIRFGSDFLDLATKAQAKNVYIYK